MTMQGFDFVGLRHINVSGNFFRYESGSGGSSARIRVRANGQDLGEYQPGEAIELDTAASSWEVVPVDPERRGMVRVGHGRVTSVRLAGEVEAVGVVPAVQSLGVSLGDKVDTLRTQLSSINIDAAEELKEEIRLLRESVNETVQIISWRTNTKSNGVAAEKLAVTGAGVWHATQLVAPEDNINGMVIRAATMACQAGAGTNASVQARFAVAPATPANLQDAAITFAWCQAFNSARVTSNPGFFVLNVKPGRGLWVLNQVTDVAALSVSYTVALELLP